MAITNPDNLRVPPAHIAALERYMSTRGGDWRVFHAKPDVATYTLCCDIGDAMVFCSVQLDTEPLFDLNREDDVNSHGQRFGEGGRIIARIPEHLLWADEAGCLGEAFAEEDRAYIRKKLNDADFRKFRAFRAGSKL